jgi:F-type H+-transporting ATPase subunit epsilon
VSLRVRVVSPSATVYDGEARSVVAPAWDGKVGILPRHAPMITLLGAGVLSIDLVGGGSREVFVAGGALQVLDDEVTVLSEYAGDVAPQELPEALVRPEEVADFIARQSKGNPLV